MKGSKGFTLVEILAIISVIGVVAVLVAPSLLKTFNNAKSMLSEYDYDGIEEAAKMYIMDLDEGITSYTLEEDTEIEGVTYSTGDTLSSYNFKLYVINKDGIKITVKDLVEDEYYDEDCVYGSENESEICDLPADCTLKVGIEYKLTSNGLYYQTTGYTVDVYEDTCQK